MKDLEKPTSRHNLERVWMQQAVIKELKKIADDNKSDVHHALQDGESIKITNDRGGDLGTVYRTKPKQRAVIEDLSVAIVDAIEGGAELEDRLPAEGSEDYWRAVDVLQEHAPHLLRTVLLEVEEERIAKDVLEDYHALGVVRPGWRISDGSGGYTAVRTNALGKKIVSHLVDQALGVLALEEANDGE